MRNLYNTRNISNSLIEWYSNNKRDLPWRKSKNIYSVWLSEIMLQQTQVDTVKPFYNNWINQYPSIASVAKTNEENLLKIWEGLGYYNRCRNFHKASRLVMDNYNGNIPIVHSDFIKLPGVGPYISAAVLSISKGKPLPAVDVNIKRVLSRILRLKKDSKRNLKYMLSTIEKWMKHNNPGDINEALMDLGATVCRPNQAQCHICPLSKNCNGYLSGNPEKYPQKVIKKSIPHFSVVTCLLWRDDRFLIMKRDKKNHLGGLWEFPGGKIKENEQMDYALRRELKEECGISINIGKKIGKVKHKYSHFSIDLYAYHCTTKNGSSIKTDQPYLWVEPEDIDQYPFPKANHKLFDILDRQEWNV